MPLPDLSLATESLIRLLERYFAQRHVWGTTPRVSFTADPLDLFAESKNEFAINLYLYNLQEDAYYKNLPASAGNTPPVRFREMGLNLYYLLSARSVTSQDTYQDSYKNEQRLMGLALKAFHDYPVLDPGTRMQSTVDTDFEADPYVFPELLRKEGDELRLTLHPASLEELNKVWTAASMPLRLSAIYQVSVVLLKAEEPEARPVPVLFRQIEAEGFQPVWIRGTVSDTAVILPGEVDRRSFTTSPALVAVGQSFRLLGTGFATAAARVLLSRPGWIDPPHEDITGWITHRSDTRIDLEVQSSGEAFTVWPGLYQIHVCSGGAPSNFSPLAIAPAIDPQDASPPGIDPPVGEAGTVFSIRGGPFSGEGIDAVGVYLGPHVLRLSETASLAPGEFRTVEEVGHPVRIEVRVPADLAKGTYAVRVLVNGISTPPTRWFEVEATP